MKSSNRLAASRHWSCVFAVTFPAVFGAEVRPLAIGAGRQIWIQAKATGIGRKALEAALKRARIPPPISRRSPRAAPCASISRASQSSELRPSIARSRSQ